MPHAQDRNLMLIHSRASDAVHHLYREFRASMLPISRRGDENVFQQQLAQYSNRLKHTLEHLANESLAAASGADAHGCQHYALSQMVGQYLVAFCQKAKSL